MVTEPSIVGSVPVTASNIDRLPTIARIWREPMIYTLIGGSSHDFATGRIGTHLGPLNEYFYQRQFTNAKACVDLGCSPRWILRETFGRWRPEISNVAATGFQDCPLELRASWAHLVNDHSGWEVIQYVRHGEGQYGQEARSRSRAFDANLVFSACDGSGQVATSIAVDGLPLLADGSIEAAEARHAIKLGVKVYAEAFPEQERTATPSILWGHLPAMSTWTNLRANPAGRRPVPTAERICILDQDDEGRTAEDLARFLAYCAGRDFTPAIPDHLLLPVGRTIPELRAIAQGGAH